MKRGHRSGACDRDVDAGQRAVAARILVPGGRGASGAPVAACSSRATPYTARQSGRLGVISSSSTSVAIGSTSASGVPGRQFGVDHQLVEHDDAGVVGADRQLVLGQDHALGGDTAQLGRAQRVPSGITAPGRATATVWPAATLGAPHTISAARAVAGVHRAHASGGRRRGGARRSAPARRRSARARRTPWWSTDSTFVPVMVRRCSISRTGRPGSQYWASHCSGTLIRTAPAGAGRSRSTAAGRARRA